MIILITRNNQRVRKEHFKTPWTLLDTNLKHGLNIKKTLVFSYSFKNYRNNVAFFLYKNIQFSFKIQETWHQTWVYF